MMHFPKEIETAVAHAAARFGRSLDLLEWPNGETDAPPNELNVLANLQWALSVADPDFDFFSEGSIAERGRVDLMASNRRISLAIEAKRYGAINERSDSVFYDLERLRAFKPAYYIGDGKRKIHDWWGKSERWALIIITSFRGDVVRDAWLTSDAQKAEQLMGQYTRVADRPRADGTGFMRLWSVSDMHRFAAPINIGDRWPDTGNGYMLCGAVSLGSGI